MGCLFCEDCKNKSIEVTPDLDQICFNSRQLSRPISIINFPLYPKIQDSFLFDCSIGEGTFGSSMKLIDKQTKAEKRLKLLPKEGFVHFSEANALLYHYESLCGFSHININPITQIYQTEDHILLVSDLIACSLSEKFEAKKREMQRKDLQSILRQVLTGVAYLHHKHINHGNIRLENILIDENGNVKLADYCHSKYFHRKKNVSSYLFSSPESFDSHTICAKCDEWSCGVLLYTLATGSFPFNAETTEQLIEKIKLNQMDSNEKFEMMEDADCKDLIEKLMMFNTKFRITVLDALKHPFFNTDCVKVVPEEELLTMPNDDDLEKENNEEFSLFNKENVSDKVNDRKNNCLLPGNSPTLSLSIHLQDILPVYYTMLLVCKDRAQVKHFMLTYYSNNYEEQISKEEANEIIAKHKKALQRDINLGITFEQGRASLIVFLNSLIRLRLYHNNSANAKALFSQLRQGKDSVTTSFGFILGELQAINPLMLVWPEKYLSALNLSPCDSITEERFTSILNQ